LTLKIEKFEEMDDGKRWDMLIGFSPQATVFHQFDWLKLMEKYTQTRLILLACLDGDEIVALIPFFYEEKSSGLFRKLTSPPYPTGVPYLGPIFPHSDRCGISKWEKRLNGFQKTLNEFIFSEVKPHSFYISTSIKFRDIRQFLWSGYDVLPRYTYVGDISLLSSVWNRFNSSTRRSIRKAEKADLIIEEGNEKDYRFLINSLVRRYKEQGKKFDLPEDYLFDIYNKFYPSHLKVFVCKHKGNIVGGHVILIFKDTASFWLGGVRPRDEKVNVNAFIIWKVIQWCNQRDIKYFDLIGANTPSVSNFKAQFGFDLKLYFWIRKLNYWLKTCSKILGICRKFTYK
jgi:hypothetical protein